MFATLKIVHLLSLILGLGLGIASLFIAARAANVDSALKPVLGRMQLINGRISFLCLIVLWITGIAMFRMHHGEAEIQLSFALKMAAVIVMTVAGATAQFFAFKAIQANQPPPANIMGPLAKTIVAAGVLAVIMAVLAFTA